METIVDQSVKEVVRECTVASNEERATFPAIVGMLMEAGVERYHADLTRGEKTYYMPDGSNEVVQSPALRCEIGAAFSAQGVEAAVRAIQAQKIKYREFCHAIAAAGCADYVVSLAGKRAIYSGRTGESFVEMFPGAK
jgi:uncharacterized protein YbcV (DUF1398 family)